MTTSELNEAIQTTIVGIRAERFTNTPVHKKLSEHLDALLAEQARRVTEVAEGE